MTLARAGGDIDRARSCKVMLRCLTATVLAAPIMVASVAAVADRLLTRGELFGDRVDELRPPN